MGVNYPGTIVTDVEKLAAVYSLFEQFRLQHNTVGEFARSNWQKYKVNWYLYALRPKHFGGNVFDRKLQRFLQEQSRLRQAILDANFLPGEFEQLPDANQIQAKEQLFGNKEQLKVLPTLATCSELEELKLVDFSNLSDFFPPDPLENFNLYTEQDDDSCLSRTATQVTGTQVPFDNDNYVYDDKGVAHFFGNYEHLTSCYRGSGSDAGSRGHIWGLANAVADFRNYSMDSHSVYLGNIASYIAIFLREVYGGAGLYMSDYWSGASNNTWYHPRNARDEGVGAFGTLYSFIYSDIIRTVLEDTLVVPLHENKDWRYIYAMANEDLGSSTAFDAYSANFDLQEGSGHTAALTGPAALLL